MELAVSVIGWSGALLTLLAYALVTNGRIDGQSRAYLIMNVLGAAGFIVNSGWNGAYPSAALNILSLGVGLAALLRVEVRALKEKKGTR